MGVATKQQYWEWCVVIKCMKGQKKWDRGRKGPLVLLYCWQKNHTDRCIWLSFAPIWGAINRMHFLQVCFCGEKSVNFRKNTQKGAVIQNALQVMSLLSQKHHFRHHCLFVHEAIKQRKKSIHNLSFHMWQSSTKWKKLIVTEEKSSGFGITLGRKTSFYRSSFNVLFYLLHMSMSYVSVVCIHLIAGFVQRFQEKKIRTHVHC